MNHTGFPFNNRGRLPEVEAPEATTLIDIERIWAMAKRQIKVVGICVFIGLCFGILYLQTTPPTYVSYAQVLIDEGLNKMVDEVSSTPINLQNDSAILSQIEIIRSARLAAVVEENLKLAENENFLRPPSSLLFKVIGYVYGSVAQAKSIFAEQPPPPVQQIDDATRAAMMTAARKEFATMILQGGISAQRIGRSYVIAIAFRSHDPQLAAFITRAYVNAYLADQLNASYEATEQAAIWTQSRLESLRQSSQRAALEVEKYRTANGLTAAHGQLISEQQLSEINTQLALAQADSARAQALSAQYAAAVEGGATAAMLNSSMVNDLPGDSPLSLLKSTYANVSKREQEISAAFGANHPQAVALRRELADLSNRVFEELKNLADNARSSYEVARSREAALKSSVEQLSGQSSVANESMVRLRELEQHATALNLLYQTFLTRYEETSQQRSFPISKVRVISQAQLPRQAATPSTMSVLGFSLTLGLMLGAGFGSLNEFNERFFRTADDVREAAGLKFLGYLPMVAPRGDAKMSTRRKLTNAHFAAVERRGTVMTVAVDMPASNFSEALRNIRVASDIVLQHTPSKVIGIVSMLPGEGKSTVASNLAALLSSNGSRTLLIDADMRNPGLSRGLGINADTGIVEAVVNHLSWRAVARPGSNDKLAIVPAVVRSRFSYTSELLSSAGMQRFIEEARGEFEHIIVDLPPLGPVVDAKAFARLADCFLVVAEWGRTPRAMMRSFLQSEPHIANKVLGVVLNKVNMRHLSRYGAAGGAEKFFDKYSRYYLDKPTARAT